MISYGEELPSRVRNNYTGYGNKRQPVRAEFRVNNSKRDPQGYRPNMKKRGKKRPGSTAVVRRGSTSSYNSRGSRSSRGLRPASSQGSRRSSRSSYSNQYYDGQEEYYPGEDMSQGYQPQYQGRPRSKKKQLRWGGEEYLDARAYPNKHSVRVADKNMRIRNVNGRTKQPELYSTINRVGEDQDAYFYPNPEYIVHPCKTY